MRKNDRHRSFISIRLNARRYADDRAGSVRQRSGVAKRRAGRMNPPARSHANVHNHFNLERHLVDRTTYKERRSAALAKRQNLARRR